MNKTFEFRDEKMTIIETTYKRGGIALEIVDEVGRPYATLTTYIENATNALPPGHFYVKTWSENEGISRAARQSGLFEDTGMRMRTGFVEAAVWKFKES